nr:hypothetical protein [Tanacetum cinerariifolium]
PEYDSFCFEIKPDQERLINLVENDNSEGDIRFLEELLIDDSILSHESFDYNFEDNSSIPRPPPKPPDVETDEFSLLFAESEDMIFDPGISD